MSIISVSPICIKTTGGYSATITGFDKTDSDCISGVVDTPGAGIIRINWNMYGIARDSHEKCNLDTSTSEFKKALKHLPKH